ncbi:MAG TPA: DUF4124 domain-containing protein [Candidatus Thiothrix moscowensis]|uniref:DUF4124 domain-containing protein n=1 Tax=unclassified Thiothrix TaxID=2636184 RepID=UPI0025FFBB43|nr:MULTISPECIES: DUF4124 domain-containing protein [unclassified Thiothrix]HRJ54056.1 DUF4124 domain-containing protein [Candidatus Thiothrix moscowensis]HRJ94202.1 DUF4124 domain-containing protein [Candidatus Thiothrix moscowensis]
MSWKAALLGAVMCAVVSLPLSAASLPWEGGVYSHFSDQEPLSEVLKTLAASQDTPIVVSPAVKEIVSLKLKEVTPKAMFDELVRTYGLIWYYDKESLYVYKEEEAQTASVSLKNRSPEEFTATLKRLEVLDERFKWNVSEIDNLVYFTGPERFISSVLELAQVTDTQRLARQRVYRWTDRNGVTNFSSEQPVSAKAEEIDVQAEKKLPGFEVVDVVKKSGK